MKQFCYNFLFSLVILLSGVGVAQSSNLELIKDYLIEEGMSEEDIKGLKVQRSSFSNSLKATNIYVIQEYKEIPIYNAIGSFVVKNGKVLSFSGKFHTNLAKKINTTTSMTVPRDAVRYVANDLGVRISMDLKTIHKGNKGETVFSDENLSREQIPVIPMYVWKNDKLLLSWDVSIYMIDGKNWYSMRVDALIG